MNCPECSASEKMLILERDGKTQLCLTCGCRFEIKEKRAIAGEGTIERPST